MKKYLFFFLIIALVLSIVACSDGAKYDSWKDTVVSFGDGIYQILHQTDETEKNIEILYNCEYNQCFLTEVYGYTQEDNYVYFAGDYDSKKAYCKLNTENNFLTYYSEENGDELVMVYLYDMLNDKKVELYSSYDEFSEDEKKIFEKLSK